MPRIAGVPLSDCVSVPAVYRSSRNSISKLLPILLSSSNVCVSIVRCKVSVLINGYIAVGYPTAQLFG